MSKPAKAVDTFERYAVHHIDWFYDAWPSQIQKLLHWLWDGKPNMERIQILVFWDDLYPLDCQRGRATCRWIFLKTRKQIEALSMMISKNKAYA